jgi:PhnB protein
MQMNACAPYLFFDGECEAALRMYQRVLGGELQLLRYADMPPDAGSPPPGCEPVSSQRVMHGMLQFDTGLLMASDAPNPSTAQPMQGISVNLSFADTARAKRVFEALAEGAREVRMPFGPTFWSEGFGMLVDRHGTPWMVGGAMKPM